MTVRRIILSALLVATPIAAISAQSVIVDPSGRGNYTDLQTALEAVADNATIRVVGGTYGPLKIAKSVTIIGDPAPRIRSSSSSSGGAQPPAIALAGTGSQTLNLVNVTVRDTPPYGWNFLGAGIAGRGFRSVHVERSVIEAMRWGPVTGSARSTPAIQLTGGTTLTLIDATVRANDADTDIPDPSSRFLSGAPGVESDGTVMVLGGRVVGGAGANMDYFTRPQSTPCSCSMIGGQGGLGVQAPTIYATPNALFGGAGGKIRVFDGPNRRWIPWGQQASGAAASTPVRTIRDDLTRGTPPLLGSGWSIRFPAVCQGGWLAIGTPARTPIALGRDLLFVNPNGPLVLLGLPRCATTFGVRVSNNATLAGTRVAAQVLDLGTLRLSTPVLGTVGY